MKTPLINKNILLISPRFFDYELRIKEEFEKLGAKVVFMQDRPFNSIIGKVVAKYSTFACLPFADYIYSKQLSDFPSQYFDLIFVINGQTLSEHFLKKMKIKYSTAHFLLYLWDSEKNRPSFSKILKYFDECFSFEKSMSEKYNIKFRPLFYIDSYKKLDSNDEVKFDLSFVGTAHTDRFEIIRNIRNKLTSHSGFFYLFLHSQLTFYVYKILYKTMRRAKKTDFSYKPINSDEIKKIYSNSLAILDIENPDQEGLTMRTFEVLGARKKLITTNIDILTYDFFLKENIMVIDRTNPVIDQSFFDIPYKEVDDNIMHKYSLSGWLCEILREYKKKE